jgi:Tfp pilus assembly protein PilZ
VKGTDRYHIADVGCIFAGEPRRVNNLSVGGLFVETEIPPESGLVVSLQLNLPGGAEIPAVGRVAWVNHPTTRRCGWLPPGFGFQLQRISFTDKMAILACLRSAHPSALRKPN